MLPPSPVLAAYDLACPSGRMAWQGNAGGFSGADLWKILDPIAPLCLRCWPPEHPSPERLNFIHAVLRHVAQRGFALAPLPRMTRAGTTWFRHAGRLWELAPWFPGEASYRRDPTHGKLAGAMRTLAEFHRAAESFPLPEQRGASPGIGQRLGALGQWMGGDLARLRGATDARRQPQLADAARVILGQFERRAESLRESLLAAATREVRLQPCLRDVWHQHVLFVGEEVSGLVDFGSLQPDCVAADVGRLVGSMAGDDPRLRQIALDAYQQVRPLDPGERVLVETFDWSTVLMAGLNWLNWICVEQRTFADWKAVEERIGEILTRLRHDAGA